MSGSIGGITASHNTMGQYLRKKVVPVNPRTSGQTTVRNFFASLAVLWGAITQANRDSFIAYANAVSVPDKIGNLIKLSGLNWYQAVNVLRLQSSLTRIDSMSSTQTLAALTSPTPTIAQAGTTFSTAFSNNLTTDQWANFVGGALAVFMSAPFNPTRVGYSGGYRFAGKIAGAVVPPTTPQLLTKTYAVFTGQQVAFKFVALNGDGRISSPVYKTAFVT